MADVLHPERPEASWEMHELPPRLLGHPYHRACFSLPATCYWPSSQGNFQSKVAWLLLSDLKIDSYQHMVGIVQGVRQTFSHLIHTTPQMP